MKAKMSIQQHRQKKVEILTPISLESTSSLQYQDIQNSLTAPKLDIQPISGDPHGKSLELDNGPVPSAKEGEGDRGRQSQCKSSGSLEETSDTRIPQEEQISSKEVPEGDFDKSEVPKHEEPTKTQAESPSDPLAAPRKEDSSEDRNDLRFNSIERCVHYPKVAAYGRALHKHMK